MKAAASAAADSRVVSARCCCRRVHSARGGNGRRVRVVVTACRRGRRISLVFSSDYLLFRPRDGSVLARNGPSSTRNICVVHVPCRCRQRLAPRAERVLFSFSFSFLLLFCGRGGVIRRCRIPRKPLLCNGDKNMMFIFLPLDTWRPNVAPLCIFN